LVERWCDELLADPSAFREMFFAYLEQAELIKQARGLGIELDDEES